MPVHALYEAFLCAHRSAYIGQLQNLIFYIYNRSVYEYKSLSAYLQALITCNICLKRMEVISCKYKIYINRLYSVCEPKAVSFKTISSLNSLNSYANFHHRQENIFYIVTDQCLITSAIIVFLYNRIYIYIYKYNYTGVET
jgi:hypothetical protein